MTGPGRSLLAALALSACAAVSPLAATEKPQPAGEIVLPADLERFEPAVRELILRKAEALESDRSSAAGWGDLGLAYEANLLWSEARACFERAVELAPTDEAWRLHLAVATREAGDFDGALDLLRALAADAPRLAAAQQRLGLALHAAGELEQALTSFSRLIDLLPSSPAGYLGAGEALLGLARPAEAIPLLQQAVALGPADPGAHHRLGLALRALGRQEEARRELALGVGATDRLLPAPLAATVERYAVHLTARIDRAAAMLAAGRAEQARDLLELCLADHPDNVTVLNNLAVAHLRLAEIERARQLLDRALEVNEAKFSTWINLTSWAVRAGQLEQALEFAHGAVARGPASAQAHASRAQVLLRLERVAEAAADFERAADLDAGDPRPRLAAAELHRRSGRYERAREIYAEAIELWPDLLPALLGLGRLELSAGRLEAAARALEEARRVAPAHPQVVRLGRDLAEAGGG